VTTTLSPFLMRIGSQHLRRERDDAHEALVPQFTADGPEDARTAWVTAVPDDHCRVLVEADVGAVRPAALLHGPHDHGLDDFTLLHAPAGDGVLDGRHDDVADTGVAPAGAAEDTDAQDLLGTRVVGDAKSRLLLNHLAPTSPSR